MTAVRLPYVRRDPARPGPSLMPYASLTPTRAGVSLTDLAFLETGAAENFLPRRISLPKARRCTRVHMTDPQRPELLDQVNALLPAQLEEIIYKFRVPRHYLNGQSQGSRSIDLIQYLQQQGRLEELADELSRRASPPVEEGTTTNPRVLRCPRCTAALDVTLPSAKVLCVACAFATASPIPGVPDLTVENALSGSDRRNRKLYDTFAWAFDPAVRAVGTITDRRLIPSWMKVEALSDERRPGRCRILEVGIGTGANAEHLIDAVRRHAPHREIELWGVDLSESMLKICAKKAGALGGCTTRLILADAHRLPFNDGFFDRVFCTGLLSELGDPRTALAEMGRVARPGRPIVAVNYGPSTESDVSLAVQLVFKTVISVFGNWVPDADRMRALLPPNAIDVDLFWPNSAHYCLRFTMPRSE